MLTANASSYGTSYLTGSVGSGGENYYTRAVTAGEPPGRWSGRAAERLGLTGEVDASVMSRLYDQGLDPRDESGRRTLGARPYRFKSAQERLESLLAAEPHATPERRAELEVEAARGGRASTAFWDMTFNQPKSVTVLHTAFEAQEARARASGDDASAAGWQAYRQAVEAAIWEGNQAALDYLEDEAAYTRVGRNGIRHQDTSGFVVASFFQHTSRGSEERGVGQHLHIHNAILNRVEGVDGKWRAVDGKLLIAHRPAASALADRVTAEAITRSTGIRFAMRPDGKAREVVGIDERVLSIASDRRQQVVGKLTELVDAFVGKSGRQPNNLELNRLSQQATLATRAAKRATGETRDQMLDRFDRETREAVDDGLSRVAADVLEARPGTEAAQQFSPEAVVAQALADVQSRRTTWTRADLARAVDAALPDHLGGLDARQIRELVTGLTRQAEAAAAAISSELPTPHLPDELRLRDGRSAYNSPLGRRYATLDQLAAERRLLAASIETGAARVSRADAEAWLDAWQARTGRTPLPDQRAAIIGTLTSGARVEVLLGPAGTGKTFTTGVVAEAWRDLTGGRVVGLAASQIATEGLAREGLDARNISQWLGAQARIQAGTASRHDAAWAVGSSDLVIVDESGMADTASLRQIVDRTLAAAGAKVMPTGDHRQLSAVGAGGAFGLMSGAAQVRELSEARRFVAGWEREASLRLRAGDSSVLGEYDKRGRLVSGGTREAAFHQAARGWLADEVSGRRSLLIVETNEDASQLSGRIRADLVRLGRVEERGAGLADGNVAGAGDLVQCLRNAYSLAGFDGNRAGPVNRQMLRVVERRPDGGLVAADRDTGERVSLPPGYVRQHVALGYAVTVYGAQGQTVTTGHAVVSASTRLESLYPAMTRGTDANTAYVVTQAEPRGVAPGAAGAEPPSTPVAVLATCLEESEYELAALTEAAASAEEAGSTRTIGERFADAADMSTSARTAASLDRLVDSGAITARQRAELAADPATGVLSRLLRSAELAGHNVDELLASAVGQRSLDGARELAAVLHHRVTVEVAGQLAPAGDSYSDRIPAGLSPAFTAHLEDLARAADDRRAELGARVAEAPPRWAVEALGPVPAGTVERLDWEYRAGVVEAHRELAAHTDQLHALPAAPRVHDVEDRASWHAAWRALGRPEADRAEAEMSEGQLRCRIAAYRREETWAPEYVADRLARVAREVEQARQTAELRRAEGRNAEAREAAEQHQKLAAERAELEAADARRQAWYAETAATREAAQRAEQELVSERSVPLDREPDRVTAEEWLAEHQRSQPAEDAARDVTEEDIADREREQEASRAAREAADREAKRVADREAAEAKRVADARATARKVAEARETLIRIQQRQAEEEARREAEAAREAEGRAREAERQRRDDELARLAEEYEAFEIIQ